MNYLTDSFYQMPRVKAIEVIIPDGTNLSDVALPLVRAAQFIIVVADTGTGKTQMAKMLAAPLGKVLLFAPEKAIVRGIATACGAEMYDEHPGAARVASTPHSARKILVMPRDLVVCDEIPFIGDVYFSDIAEENGGGRPMFLAMVAHMRSAIVHGGQVLLQSADTTAGEARAWIHLAAMLGVKDVLVVKARRECPPKRTFEMCGQTRWHDLLVDRVTSHVKGGPIIGIFTSLAGVDEISSEIKHIRRDLRILQITGHTNKEKETAELLAHPDRITQVCDVAIYTTAARAGVSIDGEAHSVFVYGYRGPSVASLLQAPARFRNIIDRTIPTYIDIDREHHRDLTLDPDALVAMARSQTSATDALVKLRCVEWDWSSDPEARIPQHRADGVLLDLWLDREIQSRREALDRFGEFRRLAAASGHDVTDLRRETVNEERRDELAGIREAGRTIRIEDWRTEVRTGATKRGKVERAAEIDYYGHMPTDATMGDGPKDAVARRKRLTDLIIVSELAVGNPLPAQSIDSEARARLLLDALRAAGVDVVMGGAVRHDLLDPWLAEGDHLRELQAALGTRHHKPGRLGPMVVETLGGECLEHDTTIEGVRVRRRADFTDALELAAHQRKKLTSAHSGDCAA